MNNIKIFLDEVRNTSEILEEEELRKYLLDIKKTNNKESREKVINSCIRLVINEAKKYSNKKISLLDLVGDGLIGLNKAIDMRESSKQNKFTTYAIRWIVQSIREGYLNITNNIGIPNHVNDIIKERGNIILEYPHLNEEGIYKILKQKFMYPESSYKDIIKGRVSGKRTKRIINKGTYMSCVKSQYNISLDFHLGEGGEDKLYDLIQGKGDIKEDINNKIIVENLLNILNNYFSFREVKMFTMKYGIGCPKYTLEQIGEDFTSIDQYTKRPKKISRERVRQIIEGVLYRIVEGRLLDKLGIEGYILTNKIFKKKGKLKSKI